MLRPYATHLDSPLHEEMISPPPMAKPMVEGTKEELSNKDNYPDLLSEGQINPITYRKFRNAKYPKDSRHR